MSRTFLEQAVVVNDPVTKSWLYFLLFFNILQHSLPLFRVKDHEKFVVVELPHLIVDKLDEVVPSFRISRWPIRWIRNRPLDLHTCLVEPPVWKANSLLDDLENLRRVQWGFDGFLFLLFKVMLVVVQDSWCVQLHWRLQREEGVQLDGVDVLEIDEIFVLFGVN